MVIVYAGHTQDAFTVFTPCHGIHSAFTASMSCVHHPAVRAACSRTSKAPQAHPWNTVLSMCLASNTARPYRPRHCQHAHNSTRRACTRGGLQACVSVCTHVRELTHEKSLDPLNLARPPSALPLPHSTVSEVSARVLQQCVPSSPWPWRACVAWE